MLSRHDANLVGRDQAIRGLALVLDSEALAATLRRLVPDREIGPVDCTYLRYKPGTSCLAGYRVLLAGHEALDVYARAFSEHNVHRLDKAGPHGTGQTLLWAGCAVLPEIRVVIRVFPHDPTMKALPHMADPDSRQRMLCRLLPHHPELWEGELECLRYRPERRYVGKLTGKDAAAAVLRCYTRRGYDESQAGSKGIISRGALRIARHLGSSNRDHLRAFEWLDGQPLSERFGDVATARQDVRLAGTALAELHAQHLKHARKRTGTSQAERLRELAGTIVALCPALTSGVQEVTLRLAQRLSQETSDTQLIHGDFHPNQVLVQQGTAALLDLDEVRWGLSAADLGNFIAHLYWNVLKGRLPGSMFDDLSGALLEGYEEAVPGVAAGRIPLYTAISLMFLAPHPFRNRLPDWPDKISQLVSAAEEFSQREFRGSGPPPKSLSQNFAGDLRSRLAARSGDRPQPGFWIGSKRARPSARQLDTSSVVVEDDRAAASDPEMSFLQAALDPAQAQRQFERNLVDFVDRHGPIELQRIRVVRHKPARRCLIEYELAVNKPASEPETILLVGKVHARRLDSATYRLQRFLWHHGFGDHSDDGVSVPEPVGCVPEFQMWLQHKVPGVIATQLLAGPCGVALARRIAEAIHKFHRSGITPRRRHTMAEELRILHERLSLVAQMQPRWAQRLERLLDACDLIGAATPEPTPRGIHRDFYPDHVIVDGSRLYLLDFDLYSEGDPALDIGNFSGHLVEQSLRTLGDSHALADRQQAIEERFLELAGEASRPAVMVYTTLTLVRHIYLSTQFPERQPLTETLLELCEDQTQTGTKTKMSTCISIPR